MNLSDFFPSLTVVGYQLKPLMNQSHTGLGSGHVQRHSLGPMLWGGTVQVAPAYHADAREVEVDLIAIQREGVTFDLHDPRVIGPRDDPDGSRLSTTQPEVEAFNGYTLRLKQLPSGYTLSKGDMLSFQYDNGTPHQALHAIRIGGQADNSGSLNLTVEPYVRDGVGEGDDVSLVRPTCRAVAKPGTVKMGQGGFLMTDGAEFEFVQRLEK